jgi:hypothetical protein
MEENKRLKILKERKNKCAGKASSNWRTALARRSLKES